MGRAGTQKQKKVAAKLVENLTVDNPKSAGEILDNIGYSKAIVKNPKMILESEGVKTELIALGFDPENAKKVVGEILDNEANEPRDRLKAAEQVFKVHGSYAAEKTINLSLQISKEERDKMLGLSSKMLEEMTHEEING
jgi:hypothetical protein